MSKQGFNDSQQKELAQIVGAVVENRLKPVTSELKKLNKRVGKLEKGMKTTINYFDHEYLDHERRITRVEGHLNLPKVSAN